VATPSSSGRPVDVVVNTGTRRIASAKAATAVTTAIAEAARAAEVEILLHRPDSLESLRALLSRLVASEVERVIVAGGDGMVHHAIQHTAGTKCALGIVAIGTGNDFASAVGLPSDTAAAMRIALGPPTAVDAIRVGDRWAASVLTVGFSVVVNERAERMRFPRGPSKYTIATLLELPRMRAKPIEITIDGLSHELDASMVAVANTSMFGGGMKIAPDASPHDGLLDVVVVRDVGRLRLARLLSTTFDGSHVEHEGVTQFRGSEVHITSTSTSGNGEAAVRADGEVFGTLPLTAVAERAALLVAGASQP